MAALYKLYVRKGSDFRQEFTVDISLATYQISVVSDNDLLSSSGLDVGFEVDNVDLPNGKFAITMDRVNTDKLSTGKGSYRIDILEVNDNIKSRLLRGKIYVDGGDEVWVI